MKGEVPLREGGGGANSVMVREDLMITLEAYPTTA